MLLSVPLLLLLEVICGPPQAFPPAPPVLVPLPAEQNYAPQGQPTPVQQGQELPVQVPEGAKPYTVNGDVYSPTTEPQLLTPSTPLHYGGQPVSEEYGANSFPASAAECHECEECQRQGKPCKSRCCLENCFSRHCRSTGDMYPHYPYFPADHGYYYSQAYNYISIPTLNTEALYGDESICGATDDLFRFYANAPIDGKYLHSTPLLSSPTTQDKKLVPQLEDLLER